MPNTYTQIYIQIVFAVKYRENLVHDSFRDELEKYICGIIKSKNCKPLAIYCMPDHTHILVGLNPVEPLSGLVRDIKSRSTQWINERKFVSEAFKWQEGFGAFSYPLSSLDNVIKYILNQPSHHAKQSFQHEYLQLLNTFEVDYKPEYLFEWFG
jgi:putative transposase